MAIQDPSGLDITRDAIPRAHGYVSEHTSSVHRVFEGAVALLAPEEHSGERRES